ncbi:hypothetical protein C0966_17590 (plasmid) [Bacillus methanolicus]|uniref:hypothetical protein n=1 Tax=Bacillus methanolicus TaxID=1471 RepID=UPI0023807A4F|nr:hypothetical protein [Bacillus methanolicus]MDE3841077.1 hypothetical protein [Bacillus methanolicus]
MYNILISFITACIVSGFLNFLYFKYQVRQQKKRRRKDLEFKLERWKETNPELYGIMKKIK